MEEYIQDLIQEFTDSSNEWKDLSLDQLNRFNDLQIKNSERNFNLILNLTSLSAAFLSIVIPLTSQSIKSRFLTETISPFFFYTLVVGIMWMVSVIMQDKKLTRENSDWIFNHLSKFQSKSLEIKFDLIEFSKNLDKESELKIKNKIESYFALRDEMKREGKNIEDKRKKEFLFILMNFLFFSFWLLFSASLILLVYWITS